MGTVGSSPESSKSSEEASTDLVKYQSEISEGAEKTVCVASTSEPRNTHQLQLEMDQSVIRSLALANEQLASAHKSTLVHLEFVYRELEKERSKKSHEVVTDQPVAPRGATEKTADELSREIQRLTDEGQDRERLNEHLSRKCFEQNEQIQETSRVIFQLESRLEEETSEKRRLRAEVEESREEIQRLKAMVTQVDGDPGDPSSESLEDFRRTLLMKREARQRAIASISSEMERLKTELQLERDSHSRTREILERTSSDDLADPSRRSGENGQTERQDSNGGCDHRSHETTLKRMEAQRLRGVLKVSDELRNDIRFQIEKIEDLRYQLEGEPEKYQERIRLLLELANSNRDGLKAREIRAGRLKDYLAQILARLDDDSRSLLCVSDDIDDEYERQIENIACLKSLYDERLRIMAELKDHAVQELREVKDKYEAFAKRTENLEDELKKAEEKIDSQDTEISTLESQLGLTKADCRDLENQMSLINGLFSQMLLGASSAEMDLDRLTQLLQENHDLITDMAREESTEAAALPKLLLDLVEQVEGRNSAQRRSEEVDSESGVQQESDIANNLPKVWRVLLELLSCHAAGSNPVSTASTSDSSDPNSCYKSVDTPAGPRLVISVSKTYIRLKELILEKKHLEKEMNRMKQLNTHLESKLGEQEKRLSTVSDELSKTWNIVGRMQAQHQQLHTHEKILRYELQQKRKMLQELKQELEYCREKWESARQKNTNTELEWRSLRREFAARKALASSNDSFNNCSGESGFSDERGDDSDEENESIEERVRPGLRRKTRKSSPRAPTPDTESEQPTDTELSESKNSHSNAQDQRMSTPDTEAEIEDVVETIVSAVDSDSLEIPTPPESNPLDQALTNVIEDLIHENPVNLISTPPSTSSPESDDPSTGSDPRPTVFSIGPLAGPSDPSLPLSPVVKSVQFSDPLIMGPSTSTSGSRSLPIFGSVSTQDGNQTNPSTSAQDAAQANGRANRSPEEALAARESRLRRLEEQAEWLMKKMNATSRRGSALSTKLEELHEVYGERSPPAPPPMPDVLPTRRIPTSLPQEAIDAEDPEESSGS